MNSSQEISHKIDQEVELDTAEMDAEETKSSLGPQVMLGIGLLGFVGFMVNSWHGQLSALKTAPETPAATATVVEKKVETEKTPEKFKTSSAAALLNLAPSEPVIAPGTEITEAGEITPEEMAELNWNLYNQIDGAWQIIPTFNQSLVYRIAVNQNGEVTDYEALNQVAADKIGETGIDTLKKSDSFVGDAGPESSAKFLAVLTPQGLLYVSPWLEK